jgi:REP element-mobilizing transposase RayT
MRGFSEGRIYNVHKIISLPVLTLLVKGRHAKKNPYRRTWRFAPHYCVRGIERRKIFYDDDDRDNFLEPLGVVLTETGTPCYAWAEIPNHTHLLLKTGTTPIATVMRRLLTGYVVTFNRRHRPAWPAL